MGSLLRKLNRYAPAAAIAALCRMAMLDEHEGLAYHWASQAHLKEMRLQMLGIFGLVALAGVLNVARGLLIRSKGMR